MVKKALSSETGVTNVELRTTDDPGTLFAVVKAYPVVPGYAGVALVSAA